MAYQHHERIDGSGYPRALAGDKIHLFARIVAVADTYDAMTSDRIYRRGVTPFEALQELKELASEGRRQLDKDVVNVFLANVAFFLPSCKAKLDTRE